MRSSRTGFRAFTSMLVVFTMLFALMPVGVPVAVAETAEGETTTESSGAGDVFDALGFDTSEMPAGYDPDSTENPMGKDGLISVTSIRQFFMMDDLGYRMAGRNSTVAASSLSETTRRAKVFPDADVTASTVKATFRSLATGDFDGDGLAQEMAYVSFVHAGGTDKRDLQVHFAGTDGSVGDAKTLLSSVDLTGTIGEPCTLRNAAADENNDDLSQLEPLTDEWQNLLQIAAGDFDADGRSEVAVYVPQPYHARVDVYKYAVTSATSDDGWKSTGNWVVGWSYAVSDGPAPPNMVSLCAGDIDRDGTDDLAISHGRMKYEWLNQPSRTELGDVYPWVYLLEVATMTVNGQDVTSTVPSKAVLLSGSKTGMLQKSQGLELPDDVVRAAFTFGDVEGDGVKELVVGAQPAADAVSDFDSRLSRNEKRFLGVYRYDGNSVTLAERTTAKVVDLKDDGTSNTRYNEKYLSLPIMPCNLAVTTIETLGKPLIYLDSVLYDFDSGAFSIKAELEDPEFVGPKPGSLDAPGSWCMATHERTDDNNDGSYALSDRWAPFWEWGAGSGDVEGSSRTALVSSMGSWDPKGFKVNEPPHNRRCTKVLYGEGNGHAIDTLYDKDAFGHYLSHAVCFPDSGLNVLMRYTGLHYVKYSDPKILAVIVSPPYFEDVAAADPNYLSTLQTSVGKSEATGTGHGDGLSFSTKEQVHLGGKLGSLEWGVDAGHFYTKDYAHEWMTTTEDAITYTTPGGEDAVALSSTPTEMYVYEQLVPDGAGGYAISRFELPVKHKTAVQVLTMAEYESARRVTGDPDLPSLSGILTHTLGDPASYPSSKSDLPSFVGGVREYGQWSGLGTGGGSVTQEIAVSKEEEESWNWTHGFVGGFDVTYKKDAGIISTPVWQAVGIKAEFSHGWVRSEVEVSESGCTYGGTVGNLPASQASSGYYFAWKLVEYHIPVLGIPVVTYLVQDVTAPPRLPVDFAQDHERTTDSTITLGWSYQEPVAGFEIYEYLDFPEGGGDYLVGRVSAGDYEVRYDSDDKALLDPRGRVKRFYTLSKGGLAQNTKRSYRIQVVRAPAPPRSTLSPVLEARTKPTVGYPTWGVMPTSLTIYPDRSAFLAAKVANLYDYEGNTAYYQWQKKRKDGGWEDITDAMYPTLGFPAPSASDEGSYRCRVNVTTKADGTAISAYTPVTKVAFSLRDVMVGDVEAASVPAGTRLSVLVSNAHADSAAVPRGKVSFQVAMSNGDTVSVDAALDDTGRATATAGLLCAGVAKITARYSPVGHIFKVGESPTLVWLLGIDKGYWLDAPDSLTYGDVAHFRVSSIEVADGRQTSREVTITSRTILCNGTPTGDEFGPDPSGSIEGTIAASRAAGVRLRVSYDEDGTEVFLESDIEILPRSLAVQIPSATGGVNVPIDPKSIEPTVVAGSLAEADRQAGFLADNMDYTYTNTAGTAVATTHASGAGTVLSTTGLYSITASPTGSLAANYRATYSPGSYAVVGTIMPLVARIRAFEGQYPGSLLVVSPAQAQVEGTSAATCGVPTGTEAILSAIPGPGYEVYDWYVNGVAQGRRSTAIAHTMLCETTTVEVQFAVKQNKLTYGPGGRVDGGTVECTTVPGLPSGSILRQGTELAFRATPAAGFHFVEWRYTPLGSKTVYSTGTPDGEAGNAYSLTMPGTSASLYAVFARDTYSLTLDPGDGLLGEYVGDHDGNAATPDETITVGSGAALPGDAVVTVRPKPGWFIKDTGAAWLADGSQGWPALDGGSYTLALTQDTTVCMLVAHGSYPVGVGFEDTSSAECTLTCYVFDEAGLSVETTTLTGENAGVTTITVDGGNRLQVDVSASHPYEFVEWTKQVGGSEVATYAREQCEIGAVGETFTLLARVEEKTRHDVVLLGQAGLLGYEYSIGGTPATACSSPTTVTAHAGESLTVRALPQAGKTVTFWEIDGTLEPALSNTYTFASVDAAHSIRPLFASSAYCTVTWPGVSAAECGVDITPVGCIPLLAAGSTFSFTATPVAGVAVEAVYANGVRLGAPVGNVYTIECWENQTISVELADVGVTVDGDDISGLMGPGWRYDPYRGVLSLSAPYQTVSGSPMNAAARMSLVLDERVSDVTLESLEMTSSKVDAAITSLCSGGVTVRLRGDNRVELEHSGYRAEQAVLSAKRLVFSEDSTGTLRLTAEIREGTGDATTLHGIRANGMVMKGGTLYVTAVNYTDPEGYEDLDDYTVSGVTLTGVEGLRMSGGYLQALAHSEARRSSSSQELPFAAGVNVLVGDMEVTGGSLYAWATTASDKPAVGGMLLDRAAVGIMLGSRPTTEAVELASQAGQFVVRGGWVQGQAVGDTGTAGALGIGVQATTVTVDAGHLKAYVERGRMSFGVNARDLHNAGGLTEIEVDETGVDGDVYVSPVTCLSTATPMDLDGAVVDLHKDSQMVAFWRELDKEREGALTTWGYSTWGPDHGVTGSVHKYWQVCSSLGSASPASATYCRGSGKGLDFQVVGPRLPEGADVFDPIPVTNIWMDDVLVPSGPPGSDVFYVNPLTDSKNLLSFVVLQSAYLDTLESGTHTMSVQCRRDPINLGIPVTIAITDPPTPPPPSAVVSISPASVDGVRGSKVAFAASVSDLVGVTADARVDWAVTSPHSAQTTITHDYAGRSATLTVGADEPVGGQLTVQATLTDHPEIVSNTATVTVLNAAESVSVTPDSVSLRPSDPASRTATFSAAVSGMGGEGVIPDVTWSVWGNRRLATTINAAGVLSVDASETGVGGLLTVTATSRTYPYPSDAAVVSLLGLPDVTPPSTEATCPAGWRTRVGETTVTLTAADAGGSGVRATYYSVDDGSPETYTAPFTVANEGKSTVSYRSIDNEGNAEATKTIEVWLDTLEPRTTCSITPLATTFGNVTVVLSAVDEGTAGSGVEQTGYRVDGGAPSVYSKLLPVVLSTEGTHSVEYWSVDVAGNVEATKTSDVITIDKSAPTGSMSVAGGSAHTNTRTVSVDSTITDALSGVNRMRYSVDGGSTWGSWVTYAPSEVVTLPAGEGTKTVVGQYDDPVGNVRGIADAIYLNYPPVAVSDAATVSDDATLTVDAPGVLANDTDPLPLTAVLVTGPAHGAIDLSSDGGYTYRTNGHFSGTDTFTYVAGDGYALSDPATVTIDVSCCDTTAPETTSDSVADYSGEATITLAATDDSGVTTTYWTLDGGSETTGTTVFVPTVGVHTLTYWSVDSHENVEAAHTETFTVWVVMKEISGPTRYATAIAASQEAFADGSASQAVIVSGQTWPDGISASALAGAVDGPLLLTPRAGLASGIATELARLGVSDVYVIGGEAAISAGVADELAGLLGGDAHVRRLGGATRYGTSALVASETVGILGGDFTGDVFVATGENWPDSVCAAALAARLGRPILLSPSAALGADAKRMLQQLPAERAALLGGTRSLSTVVFEQTAAIVGREDVVRLSGATRYDTAVVVARFGLDNGLSMTGVAIGSGLSFADTLSGGVMQGRFNSVVLLTPPTGLPASTRDMLHEYRKEVGFYRIIGGLGVVPESVRTEIGDALL